MRVCLLNDSFPPVIDGVVNVVMNYADYLIKDYASPVIVGTPRYPGADYQKYAYPVVAYPSFDTAAMASGYRTGNPFDSKAVAELADFKPDIIHAHCPASATVMARLLREQTEAPIIFTYHTKYDIDLRRTLKVKPVADETIKLMVSNIEACDDIWVVSRGAGESLVQLGFEGEYRVANNGVDFAKGRVDAETVRKVTEGYDLPEGVPMLLFVGRIITYKGLPLLMDALRLLAESGQDFRMVFVGKGPDEELMKEKAREYGLLDKEGQKDKCIFVGPVYDRNLLRAWNTRADLFVFPSTFDTNGLVVREAAACGLASVLIEGSCAAEGITDDRNGFTVPETAEAMAERLIALTKDLNHLHEVGQHAMDEIYISWQSAVAEAYDRYQLILEKKKAGTLPAKRKIPTDYLLSATAAGMDLAHSVEMSPAAQRLRRMSEDMIGYLQEATGGMMENFQESGVDVADFLKNVGENVSAGMKEAQEKTDRFWQEVTDNVTETSERIKKEFSESVSEAKAEAKEKTDRFWQEVTDNVTETTERFFKDIADLKTEAQEKSAKDGNED